MRFALPVLIFFNIALAAQELAAGRLLVGTRKSHDSVLSKSVILLVHYDQRGAIGLMLNGSKVPLSDVLPEIKDVSLPVYAGGPVTIGLRALCRGREKPPEAERVLSDVFLVASVKGSNMNMSGSCRLYGGYTGWTAGQLKNEVAQGLWRVIPAASNIVFDPHPEELWPKLSGSR